MIDCYRSSLRQFIARRSETTTAAKMAVYYLRTQRPGISPYFLCSVGTILLSQGEKAAISQTDRQTHKHTHTHTHIHTQIC
jgi:hypothetical protein